MSQVRFGSLPSYNGQKVVLDDDARLTAGVKNTISVTVDFGHPSDRYQDTTARTTVAATWVTATTSITVFPAGWASTDHGSEDAAVENVTGYACNRVAGVSFDVIATAPDGTWGRHVFLATG